MLLVTHASDIKYDNEDSSGNGAKDNELRHF